MELFLDKSQLRNSSNKNFPRTSLCKHNFVHNGFSHTIFLQLRIEMAQLNYRIIFSPDDSGAARVNRFFKKGKGKFWEKLKRIFFQIKIEKIGQKKEN